MPARAFYSVFCVRLVIFLGIVQPGEIRRAEHEHERQKMQDLVTLRGVQSFIVEVEPGCVVLKVKKRWYLNGTVTTKFVSREAISVSREVIIAPWELTRHKLC